MASITALKTGLAARLDTITGLSGYTEANPGDVNVPAYVIRRGQVSFDSTMARGSDDFVFVVTLVVGLADEKVAEDAMDPYLAGSGAKSVKAAIEGEQTLGGVAHFARVISASEDLEVTISGAAYLGVDFTVGVTADGA